MKQFFSKSWQMSATFFKTTTLVFLNHGIWNNITKVIHYINVLCKLTFHGMDPSLRWFDAGSPKLTRAIKCRVCILYSCIVCYAADVFCFPEPKVYFKLASQVSTLYFIFILFIYIFIYLLHLLYLYPTCLSTKEFEAGYNT